MDLSFDDHWVDYCADVINGPIANHPNFAGIQIKLDFASVGAIAPSEAWWVIERTVLKSKLEPGRISLSEREHLGRPREVLRGDPFRRWQTLLHRT